MSTLPAHLDLLIVGGGPVGGALALSLADSGLSIGVIEARREPGKDARALALAHASSAALAAIGVWPANAATAIHTVHVSQQHSFGRVKLDRSELDLPALGYVMPYGALATAIHKQLPAQSHIHYLTGARVTEVATLDGYAAVTLERDGETHLITTRLAVLAEGGALLGSVGIAQGSRAYDQHALVAEVETDRPHRHQAYERFADDGPIAFLPVGGESNRYAVVWTRPENDPLQASTLADADFLVQLQDRIGERVGLLQSVGPRAHFPLTLRWASQHYARRTVVIGNAAQTLHPVAGQGFNLGLRDALTLARLIKATPADRLGETNMLERFDALRRTDSLATIGFTDNLIRLFGMEAPPIRAGRALGLAALGNCKPLRRSFAHRMVFGNA
ncbi:MAG: FAD-dependent monooxygenase [Burkholderiales bacterium]|nr:FAD-dependent monooxygenase [Burkholderiales bacterium]